jgi:hypothetical protein
LTENALPIAQPLYRMNPVKKEFLKKEIVKMKAQGIIIKSSSPWTSSVVIVEKKEGDKDYLSVIYYLMIYACTTSY